MLSCRKPSGWFKRPLVLCTVVHTEQEIGSTADKSAAQHTMASANTRAINFAILDAFPIRLMKRE